MLVHVKKKGVIALQALSPVSAPLSGLYALCLRLLARPVLTKYLGGTDGPFIKDVLTEGGGG